MSAELLRDLIEIPERVLAGDFVLTLSKGVTLDSTISDYVVTPQLAEKFDQALGIIQSAVEGRVSRAAYLDGSFGSGKSHFLAVLHAILRGDPAARGKEKLAQIVGKHDRWLKGRSFLLVPFHMIDSTSLESAILGGYVDHVRKLRPEAPLPVIYRDDPLLEDARRLRASIGDQAFLASLPADEEWGPAWEAASLDLALAALPGDKERSRLVGDLLSSHYRSYAQAVSGTTASFIELDKGLAEISRHARDVMVADAVVLLLDEVVLWLSSYIGDSLRIRAEAQKVSKLIESAEHERPAPIVSFLPRQRDLRELVGQDVAGASTASLFDTLKYWDGRFDRVKLEDSNLPTIVEARLLRPKDSGAKDALDSAFRQAEQARPEVWETLLDAQGGAGSRAEFRATYPFSPAFLHTMVDVSGALQRQRTALKLMQELLVEYRDVLPVGQLMPLGAIFDVLARGADQPFSDKLREEFDQAKRFYQRVREFLLRKHRLAEAQVPELPARHAFRADDLIVKTLLLAALVPNVPALRTLTATRLAALNHGSIATMIPGQEQRMVARTLRELAGEFGEIRVSEADNPSVEINLIGVNTAEIFQQIIHVGDDADRRRLVKTLLWEDLKATDKGEFTTTWPFTWRGTERITELAFANVRDRDVADARFEPELPGAVLVMIDYPFDEGNYGPGHDRARVYELRQRHGLPPRTVIWLPSFLSAERLADLGDLVKIRYILDPQSRGRLEQLTPYWSPEDRHHARTVFEGRKSALTTRLRDALRRAYGLASPDDADLGATAEEHLMALDSQLQLRPPAGLGFADALARICGQVLDHAYPAHPDFDPDHRKHVIKRAELASVLAAVELAAQDKVGRLEPPSGELQVLRRIANPLEIATVTEVLVLREDWKLRIERRASAAGIVTDLPVSRIREWIGDEQPGLPPLVIDLLVACFAVQSDRAWMRGGQPQNPPPELGKITADMMLRRQDLPDEGEFGAANDRAASIFGASRQPVRSARAVHALAAEVRHRAAALLPAAEALVTELRRHADVLGLDDASPRLVTAREAARLVRRLTGVSDATSVLRALAVATLPKNDVIYWASLSAAARLAEAIAGVRWDVFDRTAGLADGGGQDAEPASVIVTELRSAARREEHEIALREPLRTADAAATKLLLDLAGRTVSRPGPRPAPETPSGAPHGPGVGESPGATIPADGPVPGPAGVRRRASAAQIRSVTDELLAQASAHPNAIFEITWRIVP